MLSTTQTRALTDAARMAVTCENKTGVPAELTVAQWALESGWGRHQPGNNCFGIKAYDGCFGVQLLDTVEFMAGKAVKLRQPFATFQTLEKCFEKHAQLFRAARYAPSFSQYQQTRDLAVFIEQVARVYATDPHYARMIESIAAMADVKRGLADGRAAPLAA